MLKDLVVAENGADRRRAKGLATAKKLRDIHRAQQKEIASMKAALHKLHLRSYPAFIDPRAPADADTDEKIPAVHGQR
jgi:dihydrodipicolinate synthase/N-acetylneuraminate lyase